MEREHLNAQLAYDDSSYVPRAVDTLDRMQSIVSGGPQTRQESSSIGYYEERLTQPDLVRVFDDISHFQIGLLKPPMNEAPENSSGHGAVEGEASFVPIFPFLYEKLEGGDIIMDREQFISLHVQPVQRSRVR